MMVSAWTLASVLPHPPPESDPRGGATHGVYLPPPRAPYPCYGCVPARSRLGV